MYSSRELCLVFFYNVDHSRGECKSGFESSMKFRGLGNGRPAPLGGAGRGLVSILFALRNRAAGQADLGEYRRIVAERLVHVGYDLHHLAEQGTLAVVNDFGDEIRADRLTVGVELDFPVRRIDFKRSKGCLELGLIVAEVAIDLLQR